MLSQQERQDSDVNEFENMPNLIKTKNAIVGGPGDISVGAALFEKINREGV